MPTIEQKIRDEASAKIRVRICSKKRNAAGFDITFAKQPDKATGTGGGYRSHEPNKQGALQHLYAVLRCMTPVEITITPHKEKK